MKSEMKKARLIKEANRLLDRIEANLRLMIEFSKKEKTDKKAA